MKAKGNRAVKLSLLGGALLLASCALIRSDFRSAAVVSLQDYAALLRELDRHSEAAEMEQRAARLRQALQNPYPTPLGFDAVAILKQYAALLESRGRAGEAMEIEELADEYQAANIEAWQRAIFQRSQAGKLLGDKRIVPGQRIGQLRLGEKLEGVVSVLGKGAPRGQGFESGTTTHAWDQVGLWLIADDATGTILWISVEGGPATNAHVWVELSTPEGLRLGATEQEVVAAMGNPRRMVSDGFAKSLYYDEQGIRFTLPLKGSLAGRVAALRVVTPGTPP